MYGLDYNMIILIKNGNGKIRLHLIMETTQTKKRVYIHGPQMNHQSIWMYQMYVAISGNIMDMFGMTHSVILQKEYYVMNAMEN